MSDSALVGRRLFNESAPLGGRARVAMITAGAVVVVGALCTAWLVFRAQAAREAAVLMQADGAKLRGELAAYDLVGAGETLGRLRVHSARAHAVTRDPVWAVASLVPVLGREPRAARETAAVLADVTTATRPLETALPRLDPRRAGAGRIDVAALAEVGVALPRVSAAVDTGATRMSTVDPAGLRPQLASGVVTVRDLLGTARGPLAASRPLANTLPSMLGAQGPRTWMVLLQQNAEARGTGGLVGAYAVVRTSEGRMSLVSARSRQVLDRGPAIPVGGVPDELRELWGPDLREWAGLNLSPNFPWTGRLVADGWAADSKRGRLDYVAGVDAHVVAALLAGIGPVRLADGATVSQETAVDFLSRDIYARYEDPADVDAATSELVTKVFERFTAGRLDLPAVVKAITGPVTQRRLLVWSAHDEEQRSLEQLTIGGALPSRPGAYAMAVVNNGGGNKMDAYLKVHTSYRPGVCAHGVRIGHITVDLKNTAPRKGLPRYVTVRSDLIERERIAGVPRVRAVPGSNRVLLDVYGPIASQAALTTVDGDPTLPVTGSDRGHSVWRVVVELQPGQTRRVDVALAAPAVRGDGGTQPVVLAQPMVNQPTISTEPLAPCAVVQRRG